MGCDAQYMYSSTSASWVALLALEVPCAVTMCWTWHNEMLQDMGIGSEIKEPAGTVCLGGLCVWVFPNRSK